MLTSLRLRHLLAGLVLVLPVAGCTSTSATPESVTFGASGPWKEGYGAANRRGIELALDEINHSPEWKDHPLRIQFEDDGSDGAAAARIAKGFVDNPDIVAVVGHVTSGAMVAAARVYDGHLAAVATTATSPALTGISPWAFRVISSDSMNGVKMAEYANKLGKKRAAILFENNSYGRGLTSAFRKAFNGTVISYDPIGEGKDQNFEPYVSYFKQKQPDIIFAAGTEASGLTLLKEVRRQGLTADLMGGDGWTGMVADVAGSENIIVGAPFTAEDPRTDAQAFVKLYKEHYKGQEPDGNSALGYDATKLLAKAVRSVGADRSRIRDWLAGLDEKTAFAGATGMIHFRASGDPEGKSIQMTRIHHGLLKVEGAQ